MTEPVFDAGQGTLVLGPEELRGLGLAFLSGEAAARERCGDETIERLVRAGCIRDGVVDDELVEVADTVVRPRFDVVLAAVDGDRTVRLAGWLSLHTFVMALGAPDGRFELQSGKAIDAPVLVAQLVDLGPRPRLDRQPNRVDAQVLRGWLEHGGSVPAGLGADSAARAWSVAIAEPDGGEVIWQVTVLDDPSLGYSLMESPDVEVPGADVVVLRPVTATEVFAFLSSVHQELYRGE